MATRCARSDLSGQWLRESRLAAGLTQEELAERSGLAVRTISNLERGVSARPYPRSIRLLVQALELPQDLAGEMIAGYRNDGTPGDPAGRGGDRTGQAGHALAENQRPSIVPRQLPAAPRNFVERQRELDVLARLLAETGGEPGGVVVSAISGMAGVGKTALALHWAHRVAERFPDGQLYTDLRGFSPSGTPVEPAVALRGFLDGLGVPAEQVPASLEARAGLYRSLVAGRRVLIVLDNARHTEQVRPLLPSSPGCMVLVTSRTRLTGLAVDGDADLLTLDVLGEEGAGRLLAARIGADRIAAEPDAVSELIGLCARLPLALAIVAARVVGQPGFPLAELTAELRDAARRLDGLDAGDAASSVRAVLSWSYQQLAEAPARMLRLLSVHPGPDITSAAAASLTGTALGPARSTLRTLAVANLITEYQPGRYTLHDLLRAFAAEEAQAAGRAEDNHAAMHRVLDHYLHTTNTADLMTSQERQPITLAARLPGVSPESLATRDQALAWLDAEHVVLVKLIGRAAEAGFDVHAWQLAWSLAVYFRLRGHWQYMVTTQRIALACARHLGDQDAQARMHREFGFAIGQVGRFREAHGHLRRALKLYRALGDQDGQARARLAFGCVFCLQGRVREALDSTRAALRPPPAHKHSADKAVTRITYAIALNNLGWFHAQLGDLSEALTCCEHALDLHREIGSHNGQAVTLDSLGYIYHRLGRHDQAIAHYRLAADQYRHIGDRHELAKTIGRMDETCRAAADNAAAREALRDAVHILDSMQLRH